jgi:hypothetical protein
MDEHLSNKGWSGRARNPVPKALLARWLTGATAKPAPRPHYRVVEGKVKSKANRPGGAKPVGLPVWNWEEIAFDVTLRH